MMPKIGYSILNLKKFSKKDLFFETYELRSSAIKPNIKIILDIKEKLKGEDLSLHSKLSKIFSCKKYEYSYFSESELDILKYEIMISKIIGIKRINFHMTDLPLEQKEIEDFNEIIKLSKKEGIELIYENHVCPAKSILAIAENFPELKLCLDLGHLNLAISRGIFGIDLDDFLNKINERVIHVHAHNNDGKKDLHQGLDKGTFDWKNALSKLTNLEKVIIEVMERGDTIESKKLLEEYYNKKINSSK